MLDIPDISMDYPKEAKGGKSITQPIGSYKNKEEWEIQYSSDGLPTKITIHRVERVRHGGAWRGEARQGEAEQGVARQGKAKKRKEEK